MTRVDFYILGPNAGEGREQFLCTLAGKAWRKGHRVYIHTGSGDHAQNIDELLWTWRDISFLPHARVGDPLAGETPILVGEGESAPAESGDDVMINLAHPVPPFFSRFERVVEIVGGDAAARSAARERYRFYRDRGYTLNTHEVGTNHG